MSIRASVAAAVLALLLAAPAAASGETFFVDPSGSGTECSEAAPCDEIAQALAASRLAAGTGDEIQVGPGIYVERVLINDEKDAGLTLRGAGRGADETTTPLDSTTIRPKENNKSNVVEVSKAADVTIEGLRIEASSAFVNTAGVELAAPTATLRDAHVQNDSFSAEAISVAASGSRILGTRVRQLGSARGVSIFGSQTTVADSDIRSAVTQAVDIENGLNTGTRILRSRLQAGEGGSVVTVQLNASDIVIDSSLLIGGSIGVSVTTAFTGTSLVTLSNDTIDIEAPKTGASGTAAEARSFEAGTAEVSLVNSIALERQRVEGNGNASVTCRSSIVQLQLEAGPEGTVACGSEAGNASAVPTSLFVSGNDWHLQAGSPAVDSGEGEDLLSATDLDGSPRVVDGDGDGTAVIDRGAYELPTPAPDSGSPPPSNDFGFGKLKRNRKKGTARLEVRVPGPGSLVLSGRKVKGSRLDAEAAGTYSLQVRPKRRLVRSLRSKGRARTSIRVTFTPTGGTASSRSKSLTLIRRPRR
jgi:hypothetical protein